MKTWVTLSLMCFAATLAAQQTPPHRARATEPTLRIDGRGRFKPSPTFAGIDRPQLLEYPTSNDVPDFNAGFDGSGIALTNNTFPRNKYGIGIQTDGMNAGGCVATDVTQPYTSCLTQSVNGNVVQVQAARELWTFRISYIDPTNASAAEVNIGFASFGGNSGDYSLEWVRRTTGGHSCFTFYPCDYYGLNLDYLLGTAAWSLPSCSMKLGAGYRAYVFYQSSPYDAGAVPAGAQEWYPATTAATTTRLAQPGGILWSQDYLLGRSDNALQIGGPGIQHPSVPATGYSGVHDPLNLDIASIPPATGTVTVTAYDCGVLSNLSFNITRAFIESNGHAHASSMGQPGLDQVSSLDAYSGTTDTNGHWTTFVRSGTVGDTIQYTATAPNLLGTPFTAAPLLVTTGFASLTDPGVNDVNIRYTGNTSVVGLRHPSNHNAAPELHAFVRNLAAQYNLRIGDPAMQGSLGLNDMSLPVGGVFDTGGTWAPPHSQHSFGVACDIDHVVQRFSDGVFVDIDYEDTLKSVAQDLGGFLLIEGNNNNNLHVQIPESQISDVLLREAR